MLEEEAGRCCSITFCATLAIEGAEPGFAAEVVVGAEPGLATGTVVTEPGLATGTVVTEPGLATEAGG